jgi:hypothetical protein
LEHFQTEKYILRELPLFHRKPEKQQSLSKPGYVKNKNKNKKGQYSLLQYSPFSGKELTNFHQKF